MAIIRLIVTLKILLCKRAMMWRPQNQSLLCNVYRLYRWKEAVRDQNYMLLWWSRGLLPGKVSSWVSLCVVLLLWYVGPTVGEWGRISPTCGAKIYGFPYRPLTPYIFAPQLGLILTQSPIVGPTYHRRRTTPSLPHDDTLPRRHQSNI